MPAIDLTLKTHLHSGLTPHEKVRRRGGEHASGLDYHTLILRSEFGWKAQRVNQGFALTNEAITILHASFAATQCGSQLFAYYTSVIRQLRVPECVLLKGLLQQVHL
jgi:hypothetical protein